MHMTEQYAQTEPSRAAVDALAGPVLLEFGTAWCGHCRAAQPFIGKALADRTGISHLKIEDGPGRPLGRSFRIKLWPTLILLENGQELARVVRPENEHAITQVLGDAGKSGL
ncbi:thiol reductase thioredoxin [Stutzerimonas stutzeri]|uniref:Thiol reductase thioredoxin n=1 Tax=Stutzerimonas stutzeri TaxID=316 RepID=A0A2S4AS78_STUST|nr:thioredoxin family protein [Stutzerimonas stutzeri]MCQ4264912.1 thioredoxin family protein [Stutzerimonas stutzeri]POH84316.1 thiol reductase thioredoxin [Stutzerimonas stutzeri]